MDLTDDEFRTNVEKWSDSDGRFFLKCKLCGHDFAVTTSITRFKWHWSGVEGRGVKICTRVTPFIQGAASRAIQQHQNKKQKTVMPSSGNVIVNEVVNRAISDSTQEQINQVRHSIGDLECLQMKQAVMGEARASSHVPAAGNHIDNMTVGMSLPNDTGFSPNRLTVDALEPRGTAPEAADKDKGSQLDVENMSWQAIASIAQFLEVGGLVQPNVGASSSGGLPCNTTHETRGDALQTSSKKLVGEAFEKNENVMWSWLMNDEVSSISIYGMGGVGKTTLVKHISSRLSKEGDALSNVYWITVSRDFNNNKTRDEYIIELQNRIAKCVGLNLSTEDVFHRTDELLKKLKEKQKWILILDDLWDSFDLDKVGIPIHQKGCKLIITTRSLKVCREMGCMHKIKLEPLSRKEAWALFQKNLMHDVVLSPEAEKAAKSVAMECGGLPLALVAIARSMRGVADLSEWRRVLKKLKESKVRDIEEDVFRLLKFSYDRLNGSALQQCLLYCALFPEDYQIDRDKLISYLIDEGIIIEMSSRREEFDEGHMMLNKLENVCLLERCEGTGDRFAVKMHDLIRDMAIQIQQENSQAIVKAGQWSKEAPDVKDWKENLVRVSLMTNGIHHIPPIHSPCCPNLSTLLLCGNMWLQVIPDCFFKQLYGLQVLDLSNTGVAMLPNSIFSLGTLTALLLKDCSNLIYVQSLKELKALKRLDLGGTELKNMPQDMEWLSNLKYLRLGACGHEEFPTGILPKLPCLQVLELENFAHMRVKLNEAASLMKLEALKCHFERSSDLVGYLCSRNETHSLCSYSISVGKYIKYDDDDDDDIMTLEFSSRSKIVGYGGLDFSRDEDFQLMFPNDMEKLWIIECDGATSLCDISSSIKDATELEVIHMRKCRGMENLLSSSWFCSVTPLEPPSSHGLFSRLSEFCCQDCNSMKKLFPLVLLPNLVNLKVIKVENCNNLEEIIATADEVGDKGEQCSSFSLTEFSLPNLRELCLDDLPELKSICTAKLKCDSLESVEVWDCLNLKRIPFSLPLLDSGEITPPPSLKEITVSAFEANWWDSLEWDHPKAKDVLEPFLNWW